MFNKLEKSAFDRGYRISENGIVSSKQNHNIGHIQYDNKRNVKYHVFKLRDDRGKSIPVHSHRLQAYQKFGDKIFEKDIVVRHLNGNPLDNSFKNIEIGTALDNILDIPETQRILNCLGSANVSRVCSDEVAEQIRKDKISGLTIHELIAKYNLKRTTIYHIIKTDYLSEKIKNGVIE